ncbi:MAG TPA: hypothetical protein VLU25_20715 [Acidobacteriota bacterium]|nr:hypothetical protein [Acidobacteriota bacterium]
MKKWNLSLLCLVTALAAQAWPALAGDAGQPSEAVVKAFEKIKSLEGKWTGRNGQGEPVEMTFEITGNGSAVIGYYKVDGQAHQHDMATVYHLDGARLALTHYCAVANQPRMISTKGLEGDKLSFEFLDVGNADASKDGHMHRAEYEFLSPDRFTTDWTWFQEGEARFTATVDVQRVR